MKCCVVCALYYFLLCITKNKKIKSFLLCHKVQYLRLLDLKTSQSEGIALLSLPTWQRLITVVPSDFPSRKKETNIARILKFCAKFYIFYTCIYIDPVIAMLFIPAFAELFSSMHSQVVKKIINTFSKGKKLCHFPFCFFWISILKDQYFILA